MAYTRLGPFQDGGAPYLSDATFNHFEDGLAAVPAVAAPAPTGIAAADTSNLTAAISAAQTARASLQLLAGTYVLNASLTWDCTKGSFLGMAGTVIDATGLTTGPAITVTGNAAADSWAHKSTLHTLGHFELQGPTSSSTTVDALYINASPGAVDQATIAHIFTFGFRDVLSYGNDAWCVTAIKVYAAHFNRYGVYLPAMTNSGENQQFIGCTFAGGTTVTAVKITGNCEAHFFGCSFDYNGYEASIEAGAARFFGCHFENSTAGNAMIRAQQGVVSSARTILEFHGCSFALTETTTTGRAIVEVLSGSGSKLFISFFGGLPSPYNTAYSLYVNNSTAAPKIRHDGVYIDDTGPTATGVYGADTNMIANAGFETTTFNASAPAYGGWWRGGTVTYSFDTSNPRAGATALKLVGTAGGSTTNASQRVPVGNSRRPVALSAWFNCTAYTSGTITFRVVWYAGDGTTQLRTDSIAATVAATTSGYVSRSATLVPPAAAATGDVQFYCSSDFAGTVYIDDVGMWSV